MPPGAPTMSCCAFTCSIEVMPLLYQATVTLGVEVVFPIQENLRVSNCTPGDPIACDDIMFDMIMCSTVPSCGAIEAR